MAISNHQPNIANQIESWIRWIVTCLVPNVLLQFQVFLCHFWIVVGVEIWLKPGIPAHQCTFDHLATKLMFNLSCSFLINFLIQILFNDMLRKAWIDHTNPVSILSFNYQTFRIRNIYQNTINSNFVYCYTPLKDTYSIYEVKTALRKSIWCFSFSDRWQKK